MWQAGRQSIFLKCRKLIGEPASRHKRLLQKGSNLSTAGWSYMQPSYYLLLPFVMFSIPSIPKKPPSVWIPTWCDSIPFLHVNRQYCASTKWDDVSLYIIIVRTDNICAAIIPRQWFARGNRQLWQCNLPIGVFPIPRNHTFFIPTFCALYT